MLSSYIAFGTFVLLAVSQVAHATVSYLPDTYVQHNGWHSLTFNGDKNGYAVTTLPQYKNGPDSDAQCKQAVDNSARLGDNNEPLFTGPCQTSTQQHRQVIHVQCIDQNNPHNDQTSSATITFRRRRGGKGKVVVETEGTFFYGFTGEPRRSELRSNARGVSKAGKNVGVILSCYNAKRNDAST